jgi:hypothetical protein
MKVFGNPISTTVEENSIMLVEISMKESLLTIWLRVSVSTDMLTAPSMWDTGTKTNNMDLVKRSGTMGVNIRVSTRMHQKRARVNIAGQTETDMSASGATTCSTAKVSLYGMTIGCSSETGKTI